MAALRIAEFAKWGTAPGGSAGQVADISSLVAEQVVAIGGSSAQSSLTNINTRIIRIETDAICVIAIGADPTAVAATGALRLAAGQTEYFAIEEGRQVKIANITAS